ncbi:MAG: hypothetical protein IRY94_00260 [Rhodospirillaceae bacterium]|nr:hypothetical protein [Rhodospirillaceae bacterium]
MRRRTKAGTTRVVRAPEEFLSSYADEGGRPSVESRIDGMVQDSFPASDPPASAGLRLGCPQRLPRRDHGAARP